MADDAKIPAPKPLSNKETLDKLNMLAADWVARFNGKVNFNPHLSVRTLIQPLAEAILKSAPEVATVPQIAEKVAALPVDPPCVNANWQPEVTGAARDIRATAAAVGEKNAKV